MTSPHDVCWYCGRSVSDCGPLTADHVFPRLKGGEDVCDNLIMACRSCNSSKDAKDLLAWYHDRGEFPSLRVLAHYLKLVNLYAISKGLLDQPLEALEKSDLPFDFRYFPLAYPPPEAAQDARPSHAAQLKKLGKTVKGTRARRDGSSRRPQEDR